jgi:ribonuclease HI
MFYACSAWSNSSSPSHTYTNKTLNKLKSTQARAARIISGAFKATASAALDIEVYLTPIKQQIWKHNAKMLATILSSEDAIVRKWALIPQVITGRRPPLYTSPMKAILLDLLSKQAMDRTEIETITPYITPPWWTGPRAYIDNAEDATSRHQKETKKTSSNIHIYTDGSCINRKVGAAAVCLSTGHRKESYMGPETTSTVYAAELQGISLALRIADEDTTIKEKKSKIIIYADNQAAIRTTAKPVGKSGAYLLKEIVRQINKLHAQGNTIELRWIPAHTGIHGNEQADEAAKEATGWRKYGPAYPPAEARDGLRALKSTMRTWIHKRVQAEWESDWRQNPKGRSSYRYTPKPTAKVLDLHSGRKKRESAILTQLRSDKIGFRDPLYRLHVSGFSDPTCDCFEGRETVRHVLLECRRHREIRSQELGRLPGRTDLRAVLNNRAAATRAIKFIERTGILKQFRIDHCRDESSTGGRL